MADGNFDPKTFDPYRALGVARGATAVQIKRAHRTLAKRYHPDAATGDTAQFLAAHEAYRVLSDPLLRREWDDRHAPGPVRADSPPPRGAAKARPRSRKQAQEAAPQRPRSTRSYTWSAAEVPWWEEGATRQRSRTRRPGRSAGDNERPAADHSNDQPAEPVTDFEVYNRSSGAAWSMAARAYFRRGDEDLPRRGEFSYQGTQVVTAGRARAARAAAQRPTPSAPTASPVAPPVEPASPVAPEPAPDSAPRPAPQPAAAGSPARPGMLGRLRGRLKRADR